MYYNKRHLIDAPLIPCVPPEYSYVRFFHSLPPLGDIYVYINGVVSSSRLGYLDMTYYIPFVRGKYDIQVYSAQSNTLLFELKDFDIIGGQILTFTGTLANQNLSFLPILDDVNERVDPDETKARFFNLNGGSVSIKMTSEGYAMSRQLLYGKGTEYLDIVPGNYKLEIIRTNGSEIPLVTNISLNPGRIYTVYTVGSLPPTDPSFPQASIIQILQVIDGNTLLMKCKF